MKARIFRGAIRPATWLGMPFVFGICWLVSSFMSLIYVIVLLRDDAGLLLAGVLGLAFVSLTVLLLVQGMTKQDPFRLRQMRLWLLLRLEQGNYAARKEFVYVPYTPGKPRPSDRKPL